MDFSLVLEIGAAILLPNVSIGTYLFNLSSKSTISLLNNDKFLKTFIKDNYLVISKFKDGKSLNQNEEILIESISSYVNKTNIVFFNNKHTLHHAFLQIDKAKFKREVDNVSNSISLNHNVALKNLEIQREVVSELKHEKQIDSVATGLGLSYNYYKKNGYNVWNGVNLRHVFENNISGFMNFKTAMSCGGNVLLIGTGSKVQNNMFCNYILDLNIKKKNNPYNSSNKIVRLKLDSNLENGGYDELRVLFSLYGDMSAKHSINLIKKQNIPIEDNTLIYLVDEEVRRELPNDIDYYKNYKFNVNMHLIIRIDTVNLELNNQTLNMIKVEYFNVEKLEKDELCI